MVVGEGELLGALPLVPLGHAVSAVSSRSASGGDEVLTTFDEEQTISIVKILQ